jgi:CheY-like chemotaxis protein
MPCEQEEETPVSSGASAQRRLILVIDDDLDTRTILHDLLQPMGFDVVATGSGHDGLALIEGHASKGCQIDGILLNWKMPGFNGMTVFRKLQKRHAEIPVIVMTVLSQIERIDWFEDMMRKGARDCILKPLDINLLWEKCSRHFIPPSQ